MGRKRRCTDESFVWSDGRTEKRVWRIKKDGGRYIGTAGDVVGEAQGVASGNAPQWQYTLKLPTDMGGHEMSMDDWMWMVDDKTLTNKNSDEEIGSHVCGDHDFFRKRG